MAGVRHSATAERADAACGGCGDDATIRRQNRDAGVRRGGGLGRADLKPRPTSKKAEAVMGDAPTARGCVVVGKSGAKASRHTKKASAL